MNKTASCDDAWMHDGNSHVQTEMINKQRICKLPNSIVLSVEYLISFRFNANSGIFRLTAAFSHGPPSQRSYKCEVKRSQHRNEIV